MNTLLHSTAQVAVIDKTSSIFTYDPENKGVILPKLNPELQTLLDAKESYKLTVKLDGTCGCIIKVPVSELPSFELSSTTTVDMIGFDQDFSEEDAEGEGEGEGEAQVEIEKNDEVSPTPSPNQPTPSTSTSSTTFANSTTSSSDNAFKVFICRRQDIRPTKFEPNKDYHHKRNKHKHNNSKDNNKVIKDNKDFKDKHSSSSSSSTSNTNTNTNTNTNKTKGNNNPVSNLDLVMDKSRGRLITLGGLKCWATTYFRGGGSSRVECPIWFFNLDEDTQLPSMSLGHIVGFTPLLHNHPDDKHAISCVAKNSTNGDLSLTLLVTSPADIYHHHHHHQHHNQHHNQHHHHHSQQNVTTQQEQKIVVPVKPMSAVEILEAAGHDIVTVEIMGSKISNRYNFTSDTHFVSIHGSIVFPTKYQPPALELQAISSWFHSSNNPWSDVEGFVLHFLNSNQRFKCHQGYVGREETWKGKLTSGFEFRFE